MRHTPEPQPAPLPPPPRAARTSDRTSGAASEGGEGTRQSQATRSFRGDARAHRCAGHRGPDRRRALRRWRTPARGGSGDWQRACARLCRPGFRRVPPAQARRVSRRTWVHRCERSSSCAAIVAAIVLIPAAVPPTGTLVIDAVPWAHDHGDRSRKTVSSSRCRRRRPRRCPSRCRRATTRSWSRVRLRMRRRSASACSVEPNAGTVVPTIQFRALTPEEYFEQYLVAPAAPADPRWRRPAHHAPALPFARAGRAVHDRAASGDSRSRRMIVVASSIAWRVGFRRDRVRARVACGRRRAGRRVSPWARRREATGTGR